MSGHRTVIMTAKNEGAFLLEWVAYHRLIGFDNIVIFANDCEDGSDALLTALDRAGIVRFHENSEVPEGLPADPQNRAYRRAFAMDHVRQSEWVLVIDADEFLNIHTGDGTLDALFAATGAADVISGTWLVYGNSGIIRYDDELITSRFTRAAPKDVQVSFRHYGLKTLFRPAPVHRLGIHRPFLKGEFKRPEKPLRWLNGSGEDVTRFYREKGWASSPGTKGYALCQINHYMIKSNETFLMKRYRGTANSVDKDRINFDYYDSFNSNHTTDDSMLRWAGRIKAEIAAIKALDADIAAAHDACVAFCRGKIETLVADLAQSDPEVRQKMLDPEAVQAQIAADEAWLASMAKDTARPAPPPLAAPDVQPVAEPELAPDDAAPEWLADLRRSEHRKGFYHSDIDFAAHFTDRGDHVLMVSFDNLSNVNDASLARGGWGYGFYRAEGWSHLGVMSFASNWYRDDALFDWIEGLAASGFFTRFQRVVLTGTSMGAYAATAFARLVPNAVTLAFSPQSTLDEKLVPWEQRFAPGRAQDWGGRYRDAAEGLGNAGQTFIFYDPGFGPDRRHAARYGGENVIHLKTWFASHKTALFLRRAEILKSVVRLGVAGELNEQSFYRLYRKRRDLPWYVNALTEKALAQGHSRLMRHVPERLTRDGRVHLARSIQAKLDRSEAG